MKSVESSCGCLVHQISIQSISLRIPTVHSKNFVLQQYCSTVSPKLWLTEKCNTAKSFQNTMKQICIITFMTVDVHVKRNNLTIHVDFSS